MLPTPGRKVTAPSIHLCRVMPNKPEFHEDLASEHVDPLAPTHQDFDYEQVYRDLDAGLEVDWQDDDLNEKLVQFARRILEYVVDTELAEGADRRIGRRLLTLAWVINPALFPGSPSLTSLARSIGVDAGTLARLSSEASRTFGITNRAQARWLKRKRAKVVTSRLVASVAGGSNE